MSRPWDPAIPLAETEKNKPWHVWEVLTVAGVVAGLMTALLWWLEIPWSDWSMTKTKTVGVIISLVLLAGACFFGWCPPLALICGGLSSDQVGKAIRLITRKFWKIADSNQPGRNGRIFLRWFSKRGGVLTLTIRRTGTGLQDWSAYSKKLADSIARTVGATVSKAEDDGSEFIIIGLLVIDASSGEIR